MNRWIAQLALAAALSGCTIGRLHSGAPLRGDPAQIVAGKSTRSDVLQILGPPDSIQHQTSGDVFIYQHRQVNSSSITLHDPFFTKQNLFTYSRQFDNSDVLIVMFDFSGVVQATAQKRDTDAMPIL